MKDTIASISTASGNGAIGIVRISGPKALDIALKLFSCKKLKKNNIEERKMYLGDFSSNGIKDSCLMVYFKAPRSYTGEDMIEFQLHGGRYLCEGVLQEILNSGARLAENGEFSKLAFLNGKMSLDKAEGIIDLIEAESEQEIKAGYELVKGKLFQTVTQIQDQLLEKIALLEMTIDYPEHDDEPLVKNQVENLLEKVKDQIQNLLLNAKYGKTIKNGVNVALVGKTNVGKSSLLNSLLGEERAIVTNIEGTTRDIVKESFVYKGVKFNFIDTAGIRQSDDIVEKLGIEKSKEAMKSADIVLFVVDSSKNFDNEDIEIYNQVKKFKHIVVLNKTDITINQNFQFDNFVEISCLNNMGIESLKEKLYQNSISLSSPNSLVLTNQRHIQALEKALNNIKNLNDISNLSTDILAFELKRLWGILGKITGVSENEKIIDEIFSRFCLGK